MPVLGYRSIVNGIIRLAEIPASELGTDRGVGLPAINATVDEMMQSLKNVAGNRHLGEHIIEQEDTIANNTISTTIWTTAKHEQRLPYSLGQTTFRSF